MTKIEHRELKVEINLKGIEILNSSFQLPTIPVANIKQYLYNINFESRVDVDKNLVFLVVGIEIKSEEQTFILGTLAVSCIFEILNFKDVVINNEDGQIIIPDKLLETMNIISLSTTRGIMFMTFKGTFLHNALLPIIDPKQIQHK